MAVHADTSVRMRNESYGWVARYTLAFLDDTLRHAAAAAFMAATPQANHVPPGTLDVWHRPSHREHDQGSVERFRDLLERGGYADAEAEYVDYERSHPLFLLDEDTLSAWLSSLLDRGRTDEAEALVRVWTHAYPKSGDAWSQRGSVKDMTGARDAAMDDYRRALRFDPKNRIAAERLHALAAGAP